MSEIIQKAQTVLPIWLRAAGCLDFLWPGLTAFPITAESRKRLHEAAGHLAPIPRLGLELRLNGSTLPPDLHQMARCESGDFDILRHHLPLGPAHAYPPQLLSFLEHARTDSSGCTSIPQLYFEWDFEHLQEMPSVFLPIDSTDKSSLDEADRSTKLARLLDLLQSSPEGREETSRRIWSASVEGVSVSHIGAMFARGDVLRVNYRGVKSGKLEGLLRTIGWPGDQHQASTLFNDLVEAADKVTVAVNMVGGVPGAYLGFEVLFQEQPAYEPRWKEMFAYLSAKELCTEGEACSLLMFPAQMLPYDENVAWPASWIVATELRGGDEAPSVDRALSHLKVSITCSGKVTAKAYVSAQHLWVDETLPGEQGEYCAVRAPEEAAHAAVLFLLRQRQQSGWWREFKTRLGPSDEWTTAFVACALAASGEGEAMMAAREAALKLLTRQRPNGGWGYNALCPPDADSTTWVLRLLDAGTESSGKNIALAFLHSHGTGKGCVTTYRAQGPLRFVDRAPLETAAGWQNEHLCVSANALPFLREPHQEAFARMQTQDGSWTPYWWRTPALATALAAEALAGDAACTDAVRRAVAWAKSYSPASPSPFVEAWLIRTLTLGGETDRALAKERLRGLLRAQRDDGSWAPSADLKVPEPYDLDGATAPSTMHETAGLFTTAAVLMTLSLPALQPLNDRDAS